MAGKKLMKNRHITKINGWQTTPLGQIHTTFTFLLLRNSFEMKFINIKPHKLTRTAFVSRIFIKYYGQKQCVLFITYPKNLYFTEMPN